MIWKPKEIVMAQQAFGEYTRPSAPPRADRENAVRTALGVGLVAIGGLFLVQEFTGLDVWHWSWPLFIIVPGLLLFGGFILGGRAASGLAIPASIVTTAGFLLLIQNTFNLWHTWAYTWALIFPTAVGIGLWLQGVWSDQPKAQRTGRRMAEIGLVIFLSFAAFFELVLNLSGFLGRGAGELFLPAVLILAGAYLVGQRGASARGGS
jgi:hypothetical protein